MPKQYLSLADAVDASTKTTGFERNCASAIRKLVAEVEALAQPEPVELTDAEINAIWSEPLERSTLSAFGISRIRAIMAAAKGGV